MSIGLAPQLAIGRFRAKESDVELFQAQLGLRLGDSVRWRWGGGAASARLTGHFRGDRTVIYVKDWTPSLPRQLELRPDAHGPVLLAKPPGPLAFEGPLDDCVHPLLAYADLLAEGDERARDGAAELLPPVSRTDRTGGPLSLLLTPDHVALLVELRRAAAPRIVVIGASLRN